MSHLGGLKLRPKGDLSWIDIVERAADFRDALNGRFFELSWSPTRASKEAAARSRKWEERILSESDEWERWARRLNRAHVDFLKAFERLQLRDSTRMPDWACYIRDLVSFVKQTSVEISGGVHTFRASNDPLFFLPLCTPVARYAVARLEKACAPRLLRQLSKGARRKLHAFLLSRLLAVITPAAGDFFSRFIQNRCDTTGATFGSTSPHHASAVSNSPKARFLELLDEFPVLARLVVTVAIDWEGATIEFLQRFHVDFPELSRLVNFSGSRQTRSAAIVADLQPGLSDPHDCGRTVIAMQLRGGPWLVYKPRSCQGELEWSRLVCCLRRQMRPLQPAVLPRNGYGWMEFMPFRQCRSIAEVRRFYERAGALLCVAQVARAVDLHRDNIIAVGEHPIVVDVESLWQPYVNVMALKAGLDCRLPPLARTGLLPRQRHVGVENPLSHALDSAADLKAGDNHRPRVRGHVYRACDFVMAIEKGFKQAAADLCEKSRQQTRCNQIISRIAAQPWRRILRTTARYAEMRKLAGDPGLLRNGNEHYLAILEQCAAGNVPAEIAAAEAESLAGFNIPRFSRPSKRDVSGGQQRHRARVPPPSSAELLAMLPQIRAALRAP